MSKIIDLTGQRYGKLTVIDRAENKSEKTRWLCKCDCGKTTVAYSNNLIRGKHTSCGCVRNERVANLNKSHGLSNTRLFRIWKDVKRRCYKDTRPCYDNYGGRGILMCEEWKNDFQAFYEWSMANGYSDNLSIDRIDNNGNYEPLNCRWVDEKIQANNRRCIKPIEYNGEVHSVAEWAKIKDMKPSTLYYRLSEGWSIEKALETQVG